MIHKWKIGKLETRVYKDIWEEDYELIQNEGLFQEYLEMGPLSHNSFVLISIYCEFIVTFAAA